MGKHYYKKIRTKYLLNICYFLACIILEIFLLINITTGNILLKIITIILIILILLFLIMFGMNLVTINLKKSLKKIEQGKVIQLDKSLIFIEGDTLYSSETNIHFARYKQKSEDRHIENLFVVDKLGKRSMTIDILYFSDNQSFIILNKCNFKKNWEV